MPSRARLLRHARDKTTYLETGRGPRRAHRLGRRLHRPGHRGRVKVEVRPMLLITAEAGGRSGQVFLQNAETIRVVPPAASR